MTDVPSMSIRGLTVRPSRAELDRFARGYLSRSGAGMRPPLRQMKTILLLSFAGSIAVVIVGVWLSKVVQGLNATALLVAIAAVVIIAAIAIAVPLRTRWLERREALEHFRLTMFAAENHLEYDPFVPNPTLPGMIFQLGTHRASLNVLRGSEPRIVEFGNYQHGRADGSKRTTHVWGYLAVKLDTRLPHLVLDAKSNNVIGSNLPVHLQRQQRLSLEGDFDEHFTLYCPEGYQADALYLFTPDIMQRLVGAASELDIEIVDDWLFFYAQRPFSTTDPAMWQYLFGVVGMMLDKLAQWERWHDDGADAASA